MCQCVGFNVYTRHTIGHLGVELFHAINCTGTDKQKYGTKTSQTPETQMTNSKKHAPANKTN